MYFVLYLQVRLYFASDNIALGAAPTVSNASGDLRLDVVGDITFDALGGDILKDDGTLVGTIGGFSGI